LSAEHGLSWQLLDVVPIGLLVWELAEPGDDRSLVLRYANRSAAELTGLDLPTLLDRPLHAVFREVSAEHVQLLAATCRDRDARDLGRFDRVPSSSPKLRLSAKVHPLGGGRAVVVIESVTELERAEVEARSVSKFVDSIIEHLPAMVFVKDAKDLRFVRFNRAGEELLGVPRSSMLMKNDYDLFPQEQADFFVANDRDVLGNQELRDIPQEPIETPHGTRWLHTRKIPILDDAGAPQYLLGVSLDITNQKSAEEVLRSSHEALERRVRERTAQLEQQIAERERAEEALARTEEQLRQSQKMEAIGRLAGGIAHDFNNLLSVVLGYSELVLKNLPAHSTMRSHVDQINRAGIRAADLTRQLLAFSRRQVLQARTLDLNEIVLGLESMLARLVGEDIEVLIRPGAQLSAVKADPSQVEQVIMNLVVNARDAMPVGGKLTIETSNVDLDAQFVTAHLGAERGAHVMLTVSDTGVGMDKATLNRVFEPFFTTKDTGKGTGLGLATVFGIVRQSGGLISVSSEPGNGATFKVYLPAVERVSDVPYATKPRADLRGSETILLVEDDEQVRTFAATCLRELGYRVLPALSPAEAIVQAAEFTAPIELLLTDVVMPGMGGRALAAQLLERHPGMRVLFMSGYTDDAIVRHGVLESGMAFLQKPITPALLATRTREVLDGES
jgi:PAS domain S-box-containing protein